MKQVRVFSSPWCAGCKTVKKLLAENNICFEEVDITTTEGGRKAKDIEIKSIPVTCVRSSKYSELMLVGSAPETLKRILEVIGD